MWHRSNRPSINWIMVASFILVVAFVFTVFSHKTSTHRVAYTESDRVSTETGGQIEEEKEETFLFRSEEYGFTLDVPVTWRQYSDDSVIYLVDQESTASVKITETDYFPSINSRTVESVSQELVDQGYTFLNFNRISASYMEVIYQDKGNKTYDYMDEIFWSRDDILTLSCVFEDIDLENAIDDLKVIVNSFDWRADNPIPENHSIHYSSSGSFEVCIPSEWSVGTGDGYLVASDTVNGCSLTVRVEEECKNLEKLTLLDITGLLNQGQSNFLLQSFSTSENEAYASARYLSGEQWILISMKMISSGSYQYSIVLQYPEESISDEEKDSIFSLFRTFL